MNDALRQRLAVLVREHGEEMLRDPIACRAWLLAGAGKRDGPAITALAKAVALGLPSEMVARRGQELDPNAFAERVHYSGVPVAEARWAVASWLFALEVADPTEISVWEALPRAPAVPQPAATRVRFVVARPPRRPPRPHPATTAAWCGAKLGALSGGLVLALYGLVFNVLACGIALAMSKDAGVDSDAASFRILARGAIMTIEFAAVGAVAGAAIGALYCLALWRVKGLAARIVVGGIAGGALLSGASLLAKLCVDDTLAHLLWPLDAHDLGGVAGPGALLGACGGSCLVLAGRLIEICQAIRGPAPDDRDAKLPRPSDDPNR